jgi:hypothetical protein
MYDILKQASSFIKKIRRLSLEALDLDGKLQVCWNLATIVLLLLEKLQPN